MPECVRPLDKHFCRKGITGITGGLNEPPKLQYIPLLLPRSCGNDTNRRCLMVYNAIAISSAIMAANEARRIAWYGNHRSHRTNTGHGLKFFQARAPVLTASIMPASSLTGMNAPLSPPTCDEAITPPFFTASFKRARAAVVP